MLDSPCSAASTVLDQAGFVTRRSTTCFRFSWALPNARTLANPCGRTCIFPGPVRMIPVKAGNVLHPIFQLDNEAAAKWNWAKLPPLNGANRFDPRALKPNAAVAAVAEDQRRSPLVVVGGWGDGRSAAIAFDTTWRWQMEGFELQHRFWRQLVLWLSRKDDTGGEDVFVRLDQRRYQRGSRVEFAVGALDKNREPMADAQFQVEITKPDGTQAKVNVAKRGDEMVGSFEDGALPWRLRDCGHGNRFVGRARHRTRSFHCPRPRHGTRSTRSRTHFHSIPGQPDSLTPGEPVSPPRNFLTC